MNMDKLYYTIGETAEILGESTSLVRFWSNSFPSDILSPRQFLSFGDTGVLKVGITCKIAVAVRRETPKGIVFSRRRILSA